MTEGLRTILVAAALLLANSLRAIADDLGPDRARALVELQRILPLEEILKRNEASLAGRIIELELQRDKGRDKDRDRYHYKIRVLGLDGRVTKLKVDAETGAQLPEK
ncbi:MAG: hypothetical protein SFW09_23570 [Hyphomicrobiaceae bacterium]|nr:hypothetical protein [Hyphomicrobiaceae bacterium]